MSWIRTWRLIPLTCVALLFSSCSYATDFVVVNESNQAIEVLYKLKTEFGRLSSLDAPVTTEASDLDSKGGKNWIKLASTQYHFDDLTRTVTVRLEAGRALRVTTMSNYSGHDNPHKAASYPIDYISLSGPSGSITFAGDQARVSFRYVSGNLYTLTYK